jgi:hypothetical protein
MCGRSVAACALLTHEFSNRIARGERALDEMKGTHGMQSRASIALGHCDETSECSARRRATLAASASRRLLVPLVAGAALLSAFFATKTAAAVNIGGDLDLAFPVDSRGSSGGGFGIRLGQELHIPPLEFTPEIGFTYHGFSGTYGPQIYRGIFGARLGIGEILRPGAFAHVGFGHFVPTIGDNQNAFTWDAGGFLDLTIVPFLNVGIHGSYDHVDADYGSGAYAFATFGLHADLVF